MISKAKFSLITGICFSTSIFATGKRDVLVHSYGDQTTQAISFGLDAVPKSFDSKVSSILRSIDPKIKPSSQIAKSFLFTRSNIRSQEYHFSVNGFPMCQFHMKAHESINGAVTIIGTIPDVSVDQDFVSSDWSSIQNTLENIRDNAHLQNITETINLLESKKCLWVEDGAIYPAWDVVVQSGGLNYKVAATENRVFAFNKYHFHVDGTALIYPFNPTDGQLESFELKNLLTDDNGNIIPSNDKFVTFVDPDSYTTATATATGNVASPYSFQPDPTTEPSNFAQVSVFTNANRSLDWFLERGYQNFGTNPIGIVVHAVFGNNDINNALYQPSETSNSFIYVGDGDGTLLQNLAYDYDVVAHELAHHVVFHTIKSITATSESLVIHEGLADFFTFAKTRNPCLGESICPSGTPVCPADNQCLRTADNTYQYGASDLPSQPHLRSQFVSGMLWDLYSKDGIDIDEVASIVLKAVDLLVTDSGYKHLVLAMLMVDEADYNGANCSTIYARAEARNLTSLISSFDCSTIPSLVESAEDDLGKVLEDEPVSVPATNSSSSSSNSNWCGSIGWGQQQSTVPLLSLLMLPLLLLIRRK